MDLNDIWCFVIKHDVMVRGWALIFVAGSGLWLTSKRLKLADANHLADTYTRAIDQIGSVSSTVQLGGLYALEELARKNKDYHWKIMKVLCAFVRRVAVYDSISVTVQAALTVIGQRKVHFDRPKDTEDNVAIDLSGAGLREADLIGAKLQSAKLHDTDLRSVKLNNAQLQKAQLQGADLEDAHFNGADLTGAHLERAILKDVHLGGAILKGVILAGAKVEGANVQGVNLEDSRLTQSQFESTNFDKYTIPPKGMTNPEATTSRGDSENP